MAGQSDYYAILGISSTATTEQVAAAFRAKIRETHPDHATSQEDGYRRTKMAAEVNAAGRVLRDRQRRMSYDLDRRVGTDRNREASKARQPSPPSATGQGRPWAPPGHARTHTTPGASSSAPGPSYAGPGSFSYARYVPSPPPRSFEPAMRPPARPSPRTAPFRMPEPGSVADLRARRGAFGGRNAAIAFLRFNWLGQWLVLGAVATMSLVLGRLLVPVDNTIAIYAILAWLVLGAVLAGSFGHSPIGHITSTSWKMLRSFMDDDRPSPARR